MKKSVKQCSSDISQMLPVAGSEVVTEISTSDVTSMA